MLHETVVLDDVNRVTDVELIAGLRRLVHTDQVLDAQLLVHLGEVDARGLYREYACPSMFAYCVEELCMSEAQAYLRIQAARLSRQFPRILQLVAQGALNLSGIKLIGPHLTPDNHVTLLEQVRGKGKREVELLVAAIAPKPDVPNRIRKLPETSTPPVAGPKAQAAAQAKIALEASVSPSRLDTPHTSSDASQTPLDASQTPLDTSETPNALRGIREPNHAPFTLEVPRPRGSSTPLSPGRYKVEFTAGQALHDKLGQLKDLLRHQAPDGDLAVLVERAVDLLIEHLMKRRFAQTRAPKTGRSAKPSTAQPQTANTSPAQPHTANSRFAQPHTANSRFAQPHTANSRFAQPHTVRPHMANSRTVQPHADQPNTVKAGTAQPQTANSRTAEPDTPQPRAATSHSTNLNSGTFHSAAADTAHGESTSLGVGGCSDRACTVESSLAHSARVRSSRYIPRTVVREVHRRDAGQCTFVSAEGKRCSERGFLELHHDQPYARGGGATVDNLRLVCRAHNALFAERDFGSAHTRSKRAQTRGESTNSVQREKFMLDPLRARKDKANSTRATTQ
jgi:hypothetical protein